MAWNLVDKLIPLLTDSINAALQPSAQMSSASAREIPASSLLSLTVNEEVLLQKIIFLMLQTESAS